MSPGQIIILNGAPRSGKSSIVSVIQETFDGVWMYLGVDTFKECATPKRYAPGIGLRPGGERPDLEPIVVTLYQAMYASIAAHSRLGLNVAVDVGHHDSYSKPQDILKTCARLLEGLPVLFVGVRCPIETIMARRASTPADRKHQYAVATDVEPIPAPVQRWQRDVHLPGIYDLEVDTSLLSPAQCADAIQLRLACEPRPSVFQGLARD